MEPATLTLLLLAAAVALFATRWLPADVTGLLLLCALMLGGLLTPEQALAHFGGGTVLSLAALFVLSRMVQRAGVLDWLSRLCLGGNVWLLGYRKPPASEVAEAEGAAVVRRLLTGAAGASALTGNAATTAAFLPVLDAVARRSSLPVSRVLLPLAFVCILGGSITLVGSSTNLVVSGFMPQLGLERLGFFELAWVGLPLALLGLPYLYFVAPHLLLRGNAGAAEQQLRAYISDLTVTASSPLVGKTLQQSRLGRLYGLTVVAVKRAEGQTIYAPEAGFVIQGGDTLAVEGDSAALLGAKTTLGLAERPAQKLPLSGLEAQVRLVEVVVLPGCELLGRTLREARFRERYGLSVLALHRRGKAAERLAGLRVRAGDMLLVQGAENRLGGLGEGFAVLAGDIEQPAPAGQAPLALALLVGALLLGGLGAVPLVVALLGAVALAFVLRLIDPSEAYRAIQWPVLVLVAAMLAFGEAFGATGAAEAAAAWVSGAFGSLGGLGALAGVYLLTLLLSQPMSNQAAALVALPLAVGVAGTLGYNPRPFAVTVALAASNSFLSLLEPSCLLVYGPGHYRMADFARVGLGLTLLTFVLTLVLVPLVWPL